MSNSSGPIAPTNRNLLAADASTSATQRLQDEIADDPVATGTQRATAKAASQILDQVSTDPSSSTIQERIADLGGTPTLPANDASVRAELPSSAALTDFMARTAEGTGALMWQALMTMSRDSSNDQKDAADARNAFQTGKADAKKAEIKDQEHENAAGQADAGMQLGFASAGAVVSFVAAGDKDASGNPKPVSTAIAQTLPQVFTSAGQYISKAAGPQAEANRAKLQGMHQQLVEQLADSAIENAKSSYDEAREQMKLAIKILTEHSERQTQISTTITRV